MQIQDEGPKRQGQDKSHLQILWQQIHSKILKVPLGGLFCIKKSPNFRGDFFVYILDLYSLKSSIDFSIKLGSSIKS